MNPYIICNAVLHCTVLNLKFSGNSRKIFGNSSKISENSSKILKNSSKILKNSSKILKNSIYRKFQLRALPPKLRKNKPAIRVWSIRVKFAKYWKFWPDKGFIQVLKHFQLRVFPNDDFSLFSSDNTMVSLAVQNFYFEVCIYYKKFLIRHTENTIIRTTIIAPPGDIESVNHIFWGPHKSWKIVKCWSVLRSIKQ